MAGALEPDPVFTKQQRIAELAKQAPPMGFTSLNHYLDLRWLGEAYQRTRTDAAPGVDGQTAADYGLTLRDNLASLLERAKSGTYWAPPVRRVRLQMLQTEPFAGRLTTAVADGDSLRYYPAFDLPGRSRLGPQAPVAAAAAAQLLEFNSDGSFEREIGHNLYAWSFAHSVRIACDLAADPDPTLAALFGI